MHRRTAGLRTKLPCMICLAAQDLPQAHLHTADGGLVDVVAPGDDVTASKSFIMFGGAPHCGQAAHSHCAWANVGKAPGRLHPMVVSGRGWDNAGVHSGAELNIA